MVVEQQGEENDYNTNNGSHQRHFQFLEARFAIHILVGALKSIETAPRHGQQGDAPPEVGIAKHLVDILETIVVDDDLAEQEECRPRQNGSDKIPRHILYCLSFFVQNSGKIMMEEKG